MTNEREDDRNTKLTYFLREERDKGYLGGERKKKGVWELFFCGV